MSAKKGAVGLDGKPLPEGVMPHEMKTGPGKSLWPLQWIYRLGIGKFHPFPYGFMLLLLVAVVPLILYSIDLPVFQVTQLPIVADLLAYLGVFNDRDAFVWGTWIVWWPLFVITILFFRRIWCGGFCPFGLVTDMGNKLGNKLRGGEHATPVNINSYVFMGFTTFLVIGYLHDAVNITNSVIMSVEFVMFFFVFAFISGVMMPRRTFCRSFCFVGVLPHLFGRLAFLGLKTDRDKCVNCKGQWCVAGTDKAPLNVAKLNAPLINVDGCPMYLNVPQLGHEESNRQCILCGNCIKNCPYDAIEYKYMTPGYELMKGIQLNGYETYFTLGILAVLTMFVGMEGGDTMAWGMWLTKIFQLEHLNHQWAVVGSYVILAALIIFIAYFISATISGLILRLPIDKAFKWFGYAQLPFTYLMFVRDIFVVYLVDGSILQIWLGQGPQWFMTIVPFIQIFLMVIGFSWSAFLAWRLMEYAYAHQNPGKKASWQELFAGALPHILMTFAALWFFSSQLYKDNSHPFVMIGIEGWVPYGISALTVLIFWLLCRWGYVKRFDWEETQKAQAEAQEA